MHIAIPILILLSLLLFKNRILARYFGVKSLTVKEAFDLTRNDPAGTFLLDVRPYDELESQPGIAIAKSIPIYHLENKKDQIKSLGEGRKIILVSYSGYKARKAGIRLSKAGFDKIYVMKGGVHFWQRASLPVVRRRREQKRTYG